MQRNILTSADAPTAAAFTIPCEALKIGSDVYALRTIGVARNSSARPWRCRITGTLRGNNGISGALRLDRAVVRTSLGIERDNRTAVNGESPVWVIGKSVPVVRDELA